MSRQHFSAQRAWHARLTVPAKEAKPHVQGQDRGIQESHQRHFPTPTQPVHPREDREGGKYMLHFTKKCKLDSLEQILQKVLKIQSKPLDHLYTCSRTSSLGEPRSLTNIGTAPCSITTLVFSDVPEAMLVRAQAASNYKKFQAIIMLKSWTYIKEYQIIDSKNKPEAVESPPSQETQQSEEQHLTVSLLQLEGCALVKKNNM